VEPGEIQQLGSGRDERVERRVSRATHEDLPGPVGEDRELRERIVSS
jgi:transcriptional regulator with GAF, ATPase, and Fis domain